MRAGQFDGKVLVVNSEAEAEEPACFSNETTPQRFHPALRAMKGGNVTPALRIFSALASLMIALSTSPVALAAEKTPQKTSAEEDTRPLTPAELMQRGEKVYINNCVHCHQGRGQGQPAKQHTSGVPALAGSKIANGRKEAHIDILLNGKPLTAMQPFKHLSNADLAAVITYTRNSWGNNAGEVQPADVKARRKS